MEGRNSFGLGVGLVSGITTGGSTTFFLTILPHSGAGFVVICAGATPNEGNSGSAFFSAPKAGKASLIWAF